MDLFTLKIVKSNSPQVFTLKQFVSLVFLGNHIVVLKYVTGEIIKNLINLV